MVADIRRVRGFDIAERLKIARQGAGWVVPSQSGAGKYFVTPDPDAGVNRCTCPDYDLRVKCKHVFAVEFSLKGAANADGSTTVTKPVTVTETVKKPTYKPVWPAYNKAQTNEKDKFQSLLSDLCAGVKDETPGQRDSPASRSKTPSSRPCSRSTRR